MNVLIAKSQTECAQWTDVAVVVDVLCTASTLCALLQRGKDKVVVVEDAKTAQQFLTQHPEYALFSDLPFKEGAKVTANSPYLASKSGSSPALLATEAGTPAIFALKNASSVFMGGFCNFLPLIKLLQSQPKDIMLVPGALFGHEEDVEDFLCVEAIKDYLQGFDSVYERAEEIKVTLRYREFLHASKTGDKDAQMSFEINSIPFVPVIDFSASKRLGVVRKFDKLMQKAEEAPVLYEAAPELGQTLAPIGMNIEQILANPENTILMHPQNFATLSKRKTVVKPVAKVKEQESDESKMSTKSGLGRFFRNLLGGGKKEEIEAVESVDPGYALGEMDRLELPQDMQPAPDITITAAQLEPELDIKEMTLRPELNGGMSAEAVAVEALRHLAGPSAPQEEAVVSVRLSVDEVRAVPINHAAEPILPDAAPIVASAEPMSVAQEAASFEPVLTPATAAANPISAPITAQQVVASSRADAQTDAAEPTESVPPVVPPTVAVEAQQTVSFGVKKKKKAIILFSGGLDSTTCLYWALAKGYECETLSVAYGQKHTRELAAAEYIAKGLHVRHHQINLSFPWLASSSLVNPGKEIPDLAMSEIESGKIPSTYVPGRNLVFLSIAASLLDSVQADAIVAGPNAVDFSGYPDCTPDFFAAAADAINRGTERGVKSGVEVLAPLMRLNKAQIVQLGQRLGVPFELTWSCYAGGEKPCGHCDSCKLRAKGFAEAGVKDGAVER